MIKMMIVIFITMIIITAIIIMVMTVVMSKLTDYSIMIIRIAVQQ